MSGAPSAEASWIIRWPVLAVACAAAAAVGSVELAAHLYDRLRRR